MPESGMDWQPIETAPKDGTMVLLFYRDFCGGGILITIGQFYALSPERDFEETWEHPQGSGPADMWMPLPDPPKPE